MIRVIRDTLSLEVMWPIVCLVYAENAGIETCG